MTVRQIAETAGVSRMTVSRVLNNSPGVADATRETVERVVARSGFVRSRAARALKSGRHGLIDLVVVSLGTDYVTQILRGFEAALEPTGYRLVISSRSNEDESERKWLNKISDGWTDGAALVLSAGQPARLEALRRLNVPLVVIDHEGGVGSDIPAVGATNWDGARAATEYLLSLGHRRIGMFRGPATYRCVAERVSGYRSAMETARAPVDEAWIRDGSFDPGDGYNQTLALLDLPNPPTAIFAGNDLQAFGSYAALRERGLHVPDDMSVVGFDDTFTAALVTPPLTTVRQPLAEMGRVAAQTLLRLVEGQPLDSPRVELACSLAIRESCAPPQPVG
jgi:LacI family transcriptional regulator